MKRSTYYKLALSISFLFIGLLSNAQSVSFTPDFDQDVKGDILLIGNNILGPNNNAYNGVNVTNDAVNMRYIDIDGDPTTFSSSSADLEVPNPNCYDILYAALYWGAVEAGSAPSNTVKFKGPTGGYNDITGTVIYDQPSTPVGDSFPYAYYADVTGIVTGLPNTLGTYTVANISSAEGQSNLDGNGTGFSAGWSLFVVYEDPSLPGKSITSFNGFEVISRDTGNIDVDIDGFRTIPTGPVRANFAFATLEGDKPIPGDFLSLNGTNLSTADRPVNNFFNSTVTQLSALPVNNRNPNSTNTLGFDTGIIAVPNPGNGVIANGDTSAVVTLGTERDKYFQYFFAFAVEIIEPNVVLTKIVEDDLGNDVGGQTVGLGQSLNYVIGFQNTGNDDATNTIIRDILPININFNYPSGLVLPAGVSVVSYNPATREIILSIANYLVEQNDPVYEIRIETEVVQSCSLLSDACSNTINNQAFVTYQGTDNPDFIISDDPSYSANTGCLIIPQATNFLADLDDCVFTQNEILCGASLDITAGSGYDSYSWSTDPSGTPVIGTTQTITVTSPGTYYSFNTAIAPCQSIEQQYVVTNFGNTVNNPVIPYADEVVTCPNDGKQLPNIYLCGANDVTFIETGISDASSMIWEQLDESSCDAVLDSDCANEDNTCIWNQVGTGPDFLANTSGQFRLTLNYSGGCFNQFYFNVYQNLLAPAVTSTDIICTTPGSITVTGVPTGYEYSLDGITYQSTNVFAITAAGTYTAYIRQENVDTNPCIFTVLDIQIRERDFTVSTIITQPFCNGDLGNIQVAANDVEPQYFFSIYQGVTLVNSVGPITENNYQFGNLNPGTYTVNIETEDGCTFTDDIEIIEPPVLTATSAITAPLTCNDGEITVYPVGGTAPYFYYVNSTTDFQTDPEIIVTAAGVYDITVLDFNNCRTTTSITVSATPAPEFTISSTDILCSDTADSGSITVNVTNANGNSLAYSIDGGTTFSNSPVFTSLTAGNYDVVVEYTLGSSAACTTAPQTITIAGATPITGTATLTTPYMCTTNGTITITGVSGGIAPYSYSIDGATFQGGNTFTGLTAGNYTVTVQDANSCTEVLATIPIAPLDPPTDLTFSSTALTCPSNTSDVTLTAIGGTSPLEYQITAPAGAATPYQSSNVFTGLAPGTYTFQVSDSNACIYNETYTITALPTLTVVGQTLNDITCLGDSDGSVEFTVSGSTGFTYTVNGGASTAGTSPEVLTGLGAGTYTIVVTDTATNCDATTTLTVNAPAAALAVTTTESPITCLVNGSVVINATGGWGSNMYSLTLPDGSTLPAQSSNTFTNLTQSGTYTVTVVDVNGCSVSDTFDLTTPTAPTASINTTSDLCYDATNGSTLEVTASGGVTPYEYNINGGAFQTSNIFTNVVPGNYTIIVRDAYGCEVTLATQTIEPQLTLSTVLTKDLDCTATPDAVITGTTSGGYAPFTYEVNVNGGGYTTFVPSSSPFTYTASASGTYQFQVTDAEGCIAESGITTIAPITNPTATATSIDPLCFNGTNGEVQLFGSGGSGGYTFSFAGSGFTSQSLYTNLSGNVSYTYQVQDSNACLSPEYTITLNNPTEVEASATIPANTTCSATTVITVTATGGTGSYGYSFEGGAYSSTSTYTVTNTTTTQTITYSVRDTNGCIDTETIDIPPYDPVTGMSFVDSNVITCNVTTTDVTITPTGGVAPFTFVITAPAAATGNTTGATTGIFTGLTPGNYTFEITDANGCTISASHVIAPATNIVVSGSSSDEVCFGAADGQAIFTITDVNISGNYTFSITPASGTATQTGDVVTVTGLAGGTYTINITDSTTGCVDSASVTITAATQITFTASATNVNCNNPISTISFPTLSGGTPGYTYAYVTSGSPAPALGAYSNSTTVDTSVLGLTIDVYVKDTNDCVVMTPLTIISDPTPTVTLAVDNQCTASGSNYTITATGGSGVAPYTYSLDGINFQSSATFTVTPGTYTVTVRDANGCTAVSNTLTVYPQLTLSAVLDKDITCSLPQEGQISLTATGGNVPAYSYEYSTDGGATYTGMATNVLNTTSPGSYTFMVTDANGCTAVTTTAIDLTTPTNPDITVVQTAFINCNSEETAAISITPNTTLGQAPYVYEVINTTTGTIYGTQTSGLAAGDYTVRVTDAKGCTEVENITISEPDPIIVTSHAVDITCSATGVSQGSVIVDSVTGGTGPYNYFVTGTNGYSASELNNLGNTSTTFDVVDFGLYQINVVDSNGCSVLVQDVLVASPPSDLDIVITATVDCLTGGEVVVSVSSTLSSAGPFFFDIYQGFVPAPPPGGTWQAEDSPGSESATFTGLTPGVTYTFIVYDDSTNCSYYEQAAAPVPTNSTLTTTGVTANNITCTGSADGNVSFTINSTYGVATNVDYEIFDSLSLVSTGISGSGVVPAGGALPVSNLGPLPFGNYYVLISETSGTNSGCGVVTAPFNITESAILLDVTASVSQNENCNDLGVITATASDGTAPYQYQILLDTAPAPTAASAAWASANTFTVAANGYTIYAIDAYGCIQDFDITLIRDAEPTIDPQTAPCFVGNPLSVTITGTVSVGSALYSINGTSYSANPNFTFSAPGNYTLYIQDGNGCVATTPYDVNDQLLLSAALTKDLDCTGSPDAEITLTATGGDTVYTYEVSTDGGTTYSPMATNVYTASTDGTYTFKVTDGAGCEAITTYVLDPIEDVLITTAETNVSCNGGSDGSITVTVTGGTGPFQYQLDAGAPQNSNVFTGLSQGTTYVITVIDAQSCTQASAPITISEPTVLTASHTLSVNTTCDVETIITVLGQDGTPTGSGTGYYYSFNGNGFTTTNTYTVNNNGSVQTVTYIVRDANGCEVPGSVNVDPLDPPTDLDFSATAITCLVNTSDVTLTTTNGVAPLSYEILSPASATTNTTGAGTGIFTGLPADNYIFQVTDTNGCSYQELYTVADVENIAVTGTLISDVTCNPGANGEVLFTISNFAGTYSYSINGAPTVTGQSSPTVTVSGLTGSSTQTIEVTDETTGCIATTSVDVSQPAVLGLIQDVDINATCNMGAQVSVIASGGVAPYLYSFVVSGSPAGPYSSSNSAVLDPAISTTWHVYVQDGNSCVITTPLTVTIATDPIPSGLTITGLSQCPSATNDYTFTVNVGSGIAPYEYSIGNGFQSSSTFTVNASGNYIVTVRDANGCTNTIPVDILPALQFSADITTLPSCSNDDGEITVTGSGGSGTYSYSISPNTGITFTGNVFSNVPSGMFTVTMTDTNTLCSEDISLTLGAATPVTFTPSPEDVSCNGGSDGVITVTLPASNDNPIYTYEITAPIVVGPQNSNVFAGLSENMYTVRVNSGRGCFFEEDVYVGEPAILGVSATATEFACAANNSVNTSTIEITETGGTAPYIYSINGTNYFTTNTFYIIDTGSVQNITVYVRDANGCPATDTVIINPLPAIAAPVALNAPIDCNGTGSIIINATGGSGNFTYQELPNGTPQISNIFAITGPGTYYFQVNDLDTGCTFATAPFVVDPFDNTDVVATATTPVTCFGDTNGVLEINVSGYTGNYTYEVFDALGASVGGAVAANTATNPQVITGLSGGNYTVEVVETDSPFCTTTTNTVTIGSPANPLTLVAAETANITCVSPNDQGTINSVASGGWGSYEYQLTGAATVAYSTNGRFTGLAAGDYTVNVRDARGCVASVTVRLDEPIAISATANLSSSPISCFGDQDGEITVSGVSGGQGSNYTYILNTTTPVPSASGPQASPVFGGLGAGTYSVSVTDGYNCIWTSAPIDILQPTEVDASLVMDARQTCSIPTATLTLAANGGNGPYIYSDDAAFTTPSAPFASSVTISVPVGTYSYYIQDNNGCISSVSNDIVVEPIPDLTVDLAGGTNIINCFGDNTGSIVATAQGGLGNYVYTLEDMLGNTIAATQNSPGVFTGLLSGDYVVYVSGAGGCELRTPITITERATAPVVATGNSQNITCAGLNDGTFQILSVTGGTGTFSYAISPQLNQSFDIDVVQNDLSAGDYVVLVFNEFGCNDEIRFTISEPTILAPVIDEISVEEVECDGDADGAFTVNITGGTLPYSWSLDDYNAPVYTEGTATQTQFPFTNLSGGEHTVYIRDAQGCEAEVSRTFNSVTINPEAIVDYNCDNNTPGNTVTVIVDDSVANSGLEYSIDDGVTWQFENVFTNVLPGLDYFITVSHPNGCLQSTETFDILGFDTLTLSLSQGGLNEILADANGGATPYEFTLNGENYGSANSFIIYATGLYSVTVTDSNGCTAEAEIPMEFIDVCIPNYFTPNGDGVADGWGPGCADMYRNLEVDIFDRYGRQVAVLRVGEYWDGKYEDKELPTGDYWYVVKLNSSENERDFVGHFTLYR